MASISKSHGYDVGKGGDPAQPRRATYKGERRNEKAPRGVAERFVDLQGNVVMCQLVGPGIPATQDMISRERAVLHARKTRDGTTVGFVEHGKCPLRHGVQFRHPVLEDEFANIPEDLKRPCASDPQGSTRKRDAAGFVVEHGDSCPHVEWLIKHRAEKERQRVAARPRGESVLDIERKKVAAMEAQAAEVRKTNEKLLEVLSAKAPRKGGTE